ncbi:MAG: DinB family protein [Actinomycetes bacterium]
MSLPFPSPTDPVSSRTEVFLGYLDYFRGVLVGKLGGLSESELRSSRLPSGWAPLELLKHLTYVERRWLEWGFAGRPVAQPWGDSRDGRWYVAPEESMDDLVAALHAQAAVSRAVVEAHDLADVGSPGPRWDGADPASLERVLLHLVQEYARHVGHLDVVRELVDGTVGE